MARMKPRIGITVAQYRVGQSQRFDNGTALAYSQAVWAAGGVPVMLPVLPGSEGAQLEGVDGVLFSGGVDVDPESFGAEHERGLGEVDAERDAFEFTLYRLTREAGKPRLGICRGIQLINVAEGGTLHQDIPMQPELWVDHMQAARAPTLGHRVALTQGSRLEGAYGADSVRTNSYHHQGIKDVAPRLTATAHTADGLVEAVEGDGVIAVQWHPELLFAAHAEHLAPFRALIALCQRVPA
jgi:putative glutamine amidotransferase